MTAGEQSTVERVFGPPADSNGDTTPKRPSLGEFEGLPVVGVMLELRNAAGGLNEALSVAPVVHHLGDEFDVTCRVKLVKVRHQSRDGKDEPDGPQMRVEIADVIRAVLVDQSLVQGEFDRQAKALAEAKEIAGQQSLDDAAGDGEQEPAAPTDPPFLGYDDLTADEVIERVEALDDGDVDMVDAIERWEEANGGRAPVLAAIKKWRDNG